MTYNCCKPQHNKELLSRSDIWITPDEDKEHVYVETCPDCIAEAEKETKNRIMDLLKGCVG